MVTSKERTGSRFGAITLLFSGAVLLFVLLFGGTASADQTAGTANVGGAGANTGNNGAAGNGSQNGAASGQAAAAATGGGGSDAVAPNNGSAGNSSNGTASIKTGDANATGNSATNNTQQTVVQGHNGAVVIVDQNATIVNVGVANANTGGNIAVGNASQNTAGSGQLALSAGANGDSIASNNAVARNNSGGDARIDTGDASATGSTSTNNIHQTFDGDFSGLGVVVLVDQNATVLNVGIANANTGGNVAVGNASQNLAADGQLGLALNGSGGDSVAVNNATATTNSNGSAGIMTGDANAVGNAATNNVSQVVNVNAHGTLGSIVLVDQNAAVVNVGVATANTGLNVAIGNLSPSTSIAIQGAVSGAGPPAGDSIASNDGIATTNSDGTAFIKTGNANAAGNRSTTNLTQVVNVNTDGFAIVLPNQTALVVNAGLAAANTGGNVAVGNASFNAAVVLGLAGSLAFPGFGGDSVAANFASAATTSNGYADVVTGNAGAVGNASTTNVTQTVKANINGGFVLPDQLAVVFNVGAGNANTGLNVAVGNASFNAAAVAQLAASFSFADDSVASNFGDSKTYSDGQASIHTGNANAVGNDSASTTNVSQTVDANGADNVLTNQGAGVFNIGVANANTGGNVAVGNASANIAVVVGIGFVIPALGDAVASNFGDASSWSNGKASIITGDASAVGNSATTTITQTVDAHGANGFVLSDQTAVDVNFGIGVANSGLNVALGNAALSIALVGQAAAVLFGGGGDTVAANFGSAKTKSDGSASIKTGNASAVGSRSKDTITQTVKSNGSGFALPNQTAVVANNGVGVANTGVNVATGNASINAAATLQGAFILLPFFANVDDVVASNDGIASTDSNGHAEIWTGNADAIGNDSSHTTTITQTAALNGAGFALVDQNAAVTNVGVGIANTGGNVAAGNTSFNLGVIGQLAVVAQLAFFGIVDAGDIVTSNNATASTKSDGSAKIATGSAKAVGSAATTTITQTSDYSGGGFVLVNQAATDVNVGIGIANTGGNVAVGNASLNGALALQLANLTQFAFFGFIGADDIVAANTANTSVNSNGSASIATGGASAVGNMSKDTLTQTSKANISGSGFVIDNQTVTSTNIGVGIANTGGNIALGNISANGAAALQLAGITQIAGIAIIAADGDIVAANSSNSTTNSNGTANIATGSADATGNKSTTTVNQVADSNISGSGFVINNQFAAVVNFGVGVANTGLNLAIGNGSVNGAAVIQVAGLAQIAGFALIDADGDTVASNSNNTSVTSDGSAGIATGNARAIGNDSGSTTVINQVSDTTIAGMGFSLTDQAAGVGNVGVGIANTGLNLAAGNTSQNGVLGLQVAGIAQLAGFAILNVGGDYVAANNANASTNSNGTAGIKTGDAEGIGNRSTTTVNQVAKNNVPDGDFIDVDQGVVVVNAGLGIGNSGLNLALGNASQNGVLGLQAAGVLQFAFIAVTDIDGDTVAANTQKLSNTSNGSASIATGGAGGYGNISTTTINLTDGGDITVFNVGVGIANSGLNLAVGNLSQNGIGFIQLAGFTQLAFIAVLDFDGDFVASNTISSTNWSDGSATIKTGNATGYGNTSTTTLGGLSNDGVVVVVNFGIGIANTGLNVAVANASQNNIFSLALAGFAQFGFITVLNPGDDAVANNAAVAKNISNGTAGITTGDAYALGNRSATGIVDAEDALTINFGQAFANTGQNIAAGNVSQNNTLDLQVAIAPNGIASNVADVSNTSDGTATIHTGNANAFGNIASNATCQGVNFGPSCPQPELPPLPPGFTCLPGSSNCPPPVVPPKVDTPVAKPVTPPVLARTGLNVEAELMLGLLLLAIGALLRRRARTA